MIRKTEAFPLHSTLQKTMQNKAKGMAIERATRSRYLPSIAELFQIWKNKETVDAAIRLCGGDEFGEWHYLSSTQFIDKTDYTYELYFFTGSEHGREKYFGEFVCAIREFDGQ